MASPFELGDLNGAFAAGVQLDHRRVGVIGEQSMNRLDAMAQKSAFEVDASETGLTNAQQPRTAGGAANNPTG